MHACNCVSTITVTSLLPAASPSSASQILKVYEDEFIDVIYAKQSLLKLKHKGVISQAVRTSIEDANDEDAKYLLFEHLEKNITGSTVTWRLVGVVFMAAGMGWCVYAVCVCLRWPHCKHMLPIIVYSDVL